MMSLPLGPLMSLLMSISFMAMLTKFNSALTLFVALTSGCAALTFILYKGRYFPRWIMDVLDRLTNKASLESAYAARRSTHVTIDAVLLASKLKSRVIGQNAAIDSITAQVRRRLAAQRPDKPVAVFCLAGPPGVGKTHLAKALADELYADRNHLHFFDMSQFGQPHAAASLFGQARGYVGSTSYGALTAALRDTPDCVVLLDEFEKAHPDVHKRFLTAWNDGFITETSDGARVSTAGAIFVLTTNAASRRIGEIANDHERDPDEADRLIKRALLDAQFAPEVLSRIDNVFAFRPLRGLDIARVVALEIESLCKQYGLVLEDGGIDPAILLTAIETMQSKSDGGARDIARAIERQVTDGIIEAREANAKSIRLYADGASVRIEGATFTRPAAQRNLGHVG